MRGKKTRYCTLKKLMLLVAFFGAFLTQTAEAQQAVGGGVPSQTAFFGWNYGHIASCQTYYDGTLWFYAYFQEGGSIYTSNTSTIAALAPACQTGNRVAIYVFSVNPLLWNQTYAYPFK